MIKIKGKKIKMEGNRPDLLTDLTCIVKGLKECFEEGGTSKEVSENLSVKLLILHSGMRKSLLKKAINWPKSLWT